MNFKQIIKNEILKNAAFWILLTLSSILMTSKLLGWHHTSWWIVFAPLWVPALIASAIMFTVALVIFTVKSIVYFLNWSEKDGNGLNSADNILNKENHIPEKESEFEPKIDFKRINPISDEQFVEQWNKEHEDSNMFLHTKILPFSDKVEDKDKYGW